MTTTEAPATEPETTAPEAQAPATTAPEATAPATDEPATPTASGDLLGSRKARAAALISAVLAGLGALATALQGENTGFDTITDGQWVTVVTAMLVALAGTGVGTYRTNASKA